MTYFNIFVGKYFKLIFKTLIKKIYLNLKNLYKFNVN